MVEPKYNAAEFWEERLDGGPTLMSVGHSGLGLQYNQWMYKARFRALARVLKKNDISINEKKVIEIGVGSGAYLPFWQTKKAQHITGIDITEASVASLSEKFPDLEFAQADIGSTDVTLPDSYDIATAFDILFHITDDSKFSTAISNLASMVKPGGYVVISDSFCTQPWGPYFHEYHRTHDHFATELEKVGLSIIDVEPIFFTMTTTLCNADGLGKTLSKFVSTIHRQIQRLARRKYLDGLIHLIGFILYSIDGLLARLNRNGPSLKIMVARKQT